MFILLLCSSRSGFYAARTADFYRNCKTSTRMANAKRNTMPTRWIIASTFAVDRLSAYPFDEAEDDFGAVQRGDGQQIEHGEIDADKARDVQEGIEVIGRRFRRHADGRHRPPIELSPNLPVRSSPRERSTVPPSFHE